MKTDIFSLRLGALSLAAVMLVAACGKQNPTRGASEETGDGMPRRLREAASSPEQRRAELLQRIRAADPEHATVREAVVNERNELGLIVAGRTSMDDVPKLLRSMLAELDRTFPGQDHTAIAYTPTQPPRPIGTARLDSETRDMTYTPASASYTNQQQ